MPVLRVTREAGGQETFARCAGSRADALGDVTRGGCERLAERRGVQRGDREDADAALMTAWTASEMRAGARGRGGKCRIDDGEEFVHRVQLVYEPRSCSAPTVATASFAATSN